MKGNPGSTEARNFSEKVHEGEVAMENKKETTTILDLLELTKAQTYIIKTDIQGYDCKVTSICIKSYKLIHLKIVKGKFLSIVW